MDWSLTTKTFLVCCYIVVITLAIVHNITLLTSTECPPTLITKPLALSSTYSFVSSKEHQGANRKHKRLPGCIIFGVRKGGTRALIDALALHPQIKIVRYEVHFFDNDKTYEKGVEWYRSQMPFTHKSQISIEKTPAYFSHNATPGRVFRMNPDQKLILIIRDPVVRAISDYTQVMCARQEQNKSLISFLKAAFLDDGKTINTAYKPIRNSLYSVHMREWLKYFPLKNILILDGDKFIRSPLLVLRRVERFLNLPHLISSNQLVYDENKRFYCFRKKDRSKAKCLGSSKGRTHANISSSIIHAMRKSFSPYNELFFKMVNQRWFW